MYLYVVPSSGNEEIFLSVSNVHHVLECLDCSHWKGQALKIYFFFLNVSKNAESDEPVIVLASLTALQEML